MSAKKYIYILIHVYIYAYVEGQKIKTPCKYSPLIMYSESKNYGILSSLFMSMQNTLWKSSKEWSFSPAIKFICISMGIIQEFSSS